MTDDAYAYEQVAKDLRRRMRVGGNLHPGMRLPSQRQLQKAYGMSITTIRRALQQLQAEGLIESVGKSGTYVRDRKAEDRLEALERRVAELEEQVRRLMGEDDKPAGGNPRT